MSISEKLTTVAENMPKVYDAGKKAENNEFWDNYLGDMEDCIDMFSSPFWSAKTFKPNKVIRPVLAYDMFFDFGTMTEPFDMVAHLESLGSGLDTSQVTDADGMFAYANILRLGILDFSSLDVLDSTFEGAYISTIDKIILRETTTYSNSFRNCSAISHMVVEGTIGKKGFNISHCESLDKESITSIINALSATTALLTVTLPKTAVNNAFETSQGTADGSTSTEWATLIAKKTNWTISLK